MRFGGWDRVATFACGAQLVPLPWDYTPPAPGMYTTLCTYEPATGAWATCVDRVLRQHINAEKAGEMFNDSVSHVNLVCKKAGGHLAHFTEERFHDSLVNASHYLKNASSISDHLHYPVELEYRSCERIVDAVHAEFANLDNSNDSVVWIYYYFAAIMSILLLLQLPMVRRVCLKTGAINKFRGKFQLPTMWSTKKHAQHSQWALGGLLPTSAEALLLSGFALVHTISLSYNYSIDYREVMETVPLQTLQALANRSGILSFGLMPLVIVFSSRSNILPLLTGMRYTTFLVLHRWIGRIVILDAVIHSAAFYFHELFAGGLEKAESQFWWIMGVWATIISCMILIQATGILRSRWYEVFLYTHIVLAVTFFYFCWDHVRTFGWTYWIYSSCILWGAERLHRVYSLYKNGLCHAEVTILNPNLLVLRIPRPKAWDGHSAQYAFIHILLPSVFWQSHPFTVTTCEDHLKIVVQVKEGVTRTLQRAAQTRALCNMERTVTIPLLVEGPYGIKPSFERFSTVLLISGGSGIPGPLALARELESNSKWGGNVRFIAVVRDADVLEAYRNEIQELTNSHQVKVDLYYTGRKNIHDSSFQLHRSRPNMEEVFENLFYEELLSAAVVCCGPPVLDDQSRNIVAQCVLENPTMDIEYFEEFQIW